MKKIVLVLITVVLGSVASFAQHADATIEKSFDVSGFNRLNISSMLTVNIEQTSDEYVNAELPGELMRYLLMEVRNNTLYAYIDWDHAGRKLYRKYSDDDYIRDFVVNIGMKELYEIEASGMSRIYVSGPFTVNKNMEMDLSGASSLIGEFNGGNNIEIDLSGASTSELTINNFNEISLDCSGASKIEINSQCDISEIDASGASEINYVLTKKTSQINIDVSGASRIDISGQTTHMELEASGASRVNARKLSSDTAGIELTGASSLDLQQDTRITYIETSGASSIRMH